MEDEDEQRSRVTLSGNARTQVAEEILNFVLIH